MLLTVVAALTVATAIVLAAHAARDRRALLGELRAVREELRELTARTTAAGHEADAVEPGPEGAVLIEPPCLLDEEADTASGEGEQPSRSTRTVH